MNTLRIYTLLLSLLLLATAACTPTTEDQNALPTLIDLPQDAETSVAIAATPTSDAPNLQPTDDANQDADPAATETPTTPEDAATITLTPSMTITNTMTPTPSETPIPTTEPGLLDELVMLAMQATILPPQYSGIVPGITPGIVSPTLAATAAPGCATPPGGFGVLFNNDPSVREAIGCALGAPPTYFVRSGAGQAFQHGFMIWVSGTPNYIYTFYNNGSFLRSLDTFNETFDPHSNGEMPPSPNLFEPIRGFGKVWRANPDVRNGLGWATSGETAGQVTTLDFQRGMLINLATRQDIIMIINNETTADRGLWRSMAGAP